MKEVSCEYETEQQFQTLGALVQSFENGSINMDKFLIWVLKNYETGSSIMLHRLKN